MRPVAFVVVSQKWHMQEHRLDLRDQGGGGSTRGSSEMTEVYARSPVSLVTWIERSLGLKGVKIIVNTVNQSSLSGSLCPAIVCKSCTDLGRSRGGRSRRIISG
jgi:hypothetical protein